MSRCARALGHDCAVPDAQASVGRGTDPSSMTVALIGSGNSVSEWLALTGR